LGLTTPALGEDIPTTSNYLPHQQ